MALYTIFNGAAPTTAVMPSVTTGTAIKTMLQLRATRQLTIVEWGISFDGSAAATPIPVEMLATGTVFATVTAHVAAGVAQFNPAGDSAAPATAGFTLSTTGTGYTATAEGSITASKMYDRQLVPPTGQYVKQFPLGREPILAIGDAGRIRVHAAAAVNACCYFIVDI